MTDNPTRIVAAAIRYKTPYLSTAVVVSVAAPLRHHHIINALFARAAFSTGADDEQGFLTNEGRFVGRKTALKIAKAAGQIIHKRGHPKELYSEDLW